MKLRNFFIPAIIAAASVLSAGSAAASSASKTFDWSGPYIGAHAGYGFGKSKVRTTLRDPNGAPFLPSANNSFKSKGLLGGAQLGYNLQISNIVLGVEGEYSRANSKGSFNFDPTRPEATAGGKLKHLGAVKGRVGYALDRTLIYGTGGYAFGWTNSHANNVWALSPAEDRAKGSGHIKGLVVGGGVEYALAKNISVKGEYNYYRLGRGDMDLRSNAYPAGVVLQAEPKLDQHVVKAGVNFRF